MLKGEKEVSLLSKQYNKGRKNVRKCEILTKIYWNARDVTIEKQGKERNKE
jgi:hypothetical protein